MSAVHPDSQPAGVPDLDAFERLVHMRRSSLLCDSSREVSRDTVERLCSMVFAAPNHKRTAPWQVAVFSGQSRTRLGHVLAGDLVAAVPDAPDARVDKTRVKYQRAPVIVVVGCRPDPDAARHREDMAAVAAGVENLLLGATAAGLVTLWSSPPVPLAPRTNSLAEFAEGTELLALVYLGWPSGPAPVSAERTTVVKWI